MATQQYWQARYWHPDYWHDAYWAPAGATVPLAFDAAVASLRTGTASPHTWTHTPVGSPRGILVAVIHGTTVTDHVTAITYGGTPMARMVRATDTATEPGAAEWWFLGTPPTGPQTVSATCGSTTDDIQFVSLSFTGPGNTEVLDTDSLEQNVADPQRTLQVGGREAIAVCAIYSGRPNTTDLTPLAGMTSVLAVDAGAFVFRVDRQTASSTSDPTIGYTAGSDDTAFVAISIASLVSLGAVLDGSATLSLTAAGTLTTEIPLDGAAAATLTATADLTTAIALESSVVLEVLASAPGFFDEAYEAGYFRSGYFHTDYWHVDYWGIAGTPAATGGGRSLLAFWLGGAAAPVGVLAANATLTVTATGDLTTGILPTASARLEINAVATLTTGIPLVAPASTLRLLSTAELTTEIALEAAATLALTATADLTGGEGPLMAAITLAVTATGDLTTEIPLVGSSALVLTATASLDTAIPLAAAPSLTLTAAAPLTTAIRLAATPSTMTLSATASLTGGTVPLLASATLRATATGTLTTEIPLVGSLTLALVVTATLTDLIPPPDGQIRSGTAMVVEGEPSHVQLDGITSEEVVLLEAGQFFKFQGESMLWYRVNAVLSITPPVVIELVSNYNGIVPQGIPSAYCVQRNFTDLLSLPELFARDVDIRDVYTLALRILDPQLASGVQRRGRATVTAAATTQVVTGIFPITYRVLVTPTWLTTYRVAAQSTTQFTVEFADAAPADAEVSWAVLA